MATYDLDETFTVDAGDCPLSDKYSAVSEYDLVFEKSIIEARGLQYSLIGFCDEQMEFHCSQQVDEAVLDRKRENIYF